MLEAYCICLPSVVLNGGDRPFIFFLIHGKVLEVVPSLTERCYGLLLYCRYDVFRLLSTRRIVYNSQRRSSGYHAENS